MARQPRIHYEGAVYHVIARGNNREVIFQTDDDKQKYLSLVADYKEKYNFRLYAYALLDNHLHLLIKVTNYPLAKIMQGVQQSYTQYYNTRYRRVGHVFQQRYKAKLCTQDHYLLSLVKYIHYNPLKAGLSDSLNYRWSSHREYSNYQVLVDTDFIVSLFSDDDKKAKQRYQAFMEQADYEEANLEHAYVGEIPDDAITDVEDNSALTCQQLLDSICRLAEISKEYLCGLSRRRDIVNARKIFIYLAVKYNVAIGADIAKILQINSSQVSRSFNSVMNNPECKEKAEKLYANIIKEDAKTQ